jgi:hypothetical protein
MTRAADGTMTWTTSTFDRAARVHVRAPLRVGELPLRRCQSWRNVRVLDAAIRSSTRT